MNLLMAIINSLQYGNDENLLKGVKEQTIAMHRAVNDDNQQ